jgi:hypothetical protein
MHDLESFFWVLFWICIRYDGQGKVTGPTEFESWNYESDNKLVRSKVDTIGDESIFLKIAEESFSTHYQLLIPCVNRLRRKVFPNGGRWKTEDLDLYFRMKLVFQAARETEESRLH